MSSLSHAACALITDKSTDLSLIRAIDAGSEKALSVLYLRYYDKMLRNATVILKDNEKACDVVQDFFYYFIRRKVCSQLLEKYDIHKEYYESIEGYLFVAIRNRCMNVLERTKKTVPDIPDMPDPSYRLDSQLERADFNKGILQALKMYVDPRAIEICLLKFKDELSHKDISILTGLEVQTIKNALVLGYEALRKYFNPSPMELELQKIMKQARQINTEFPKKTFDNVVKVAVPDSDDWQPKRGRPLGSKIDKTRKAAELLLQMCG